MPSTTASAHKGHVDLHVYVTRKHLRYLDRICEYYDIKRSDAMRRLLDEAMAAKGEIGERITQ